MSKPTPNDYIVYRAHQWRKSDKAAIAAHAGEKDAAKRIHHAETRELRNAVDLAVRNGAPIPDFGGEP